MCVFSSKLQINDLIFVMKKERYRHLWQINVIEACQEGNSITMRYLDDAISKSETFLQSIYQEKDKIYLVEHLNYRIARLFVFSFNSSKLEIKYYF